MNIWKISLSSWIIQDGNYPDFVVGQQVEFALEFDLSDHRISKAGNIQVEHIHNCEYNITAKVVYCEKDVWVIDFGLLAYNEHLSKPVAIGDYITGKVWLGIDYYPYFESMSKKDKIPAMIYTWEIAQILQQTAPFVKQIHPGPGFLKGREVLVRDPMKLGYKEIEATNAWDDDNGSAEYILVCDELGIAAKRTSKTAT